MSIKDLKSLDYAGIALRHCEKAAIVVVTCLFVLFVLGGLKKVGGAAKISPEELSGLADDLGRRVTSSDWNDGVAKENGFEDLNFRDQIQTLVGGANARSFQWKQRFFHFLDYGGVLRKQPEILVPSDLLAYADRAAVSMYVWNDKKNALDEETIEVVARKNEEGDEEEDDAKKKKTSRKKEVASKTGQVPPGGMGGRGGRGGRNMAEGGMAGGMGGMGMGGMGMGEMGGGEGGMPMAGRGTGGRGAGGQVSGDEGGMGGAGMGESGDSMRGAAEKKGGTVRRSSNRARTEKRFAATKDKDGDSDDLGKDGKTPTKRTVPKEQVRGIRWAMVTAIYPHGEQVAKFFESLHTREDQPQYLRLKVQRRELNSDGSFTEWKDYDWAKADKEALRLLPGQLDSKRRLPEDPDMVSAGAIYQGLVMPMPELEAGEWAFFDREVAYEAALETSNRAAGSAAGEGDADSGVSNEQEQEMGANIAFGNAGAQGMAGAGGMGGGGRYSGMAGASGMGGGADMSRSKGGMGGMGMAGMGGMGGAMGGARGGGSSDPGQRGTTGQGGQASKSKAKEKRTIQKCAAKSVQIRFIDYTVQPEHTYQYRLKVVVENPNGPLAYPGGRLDVAEESFATEPTLESKEWSAPSTPVFVPPDTQYFVLERIKTRPEAKLQVHRWWPDLADWQMADFTIKPGDPIGNPKQQDFVGWDNRRMKRDFDFTTHDLLLDVTGGDRRFSFQLPGENSERSFNEAMPCRVFVVDRLGDLASRNEDIDKHDGIRVEREEYLIDLLAGAEKLDRKAAAAAGKAAEKGGSEDFDDAVPKRKDN